MADGYQALYRRYRAKRFADQRGQDHVMRALRTAVVNDRVGHAYLFSGPRGTGKTSTARILAKVLNCEAPVDGEPCGECPNCIAVDEGRIVDWLLELDAASNNGVANIRDLIERIPLGTSGNRKVVILDEVHMLSTGASNALLKSLEEPPAHVVFILATTDPQKVLPTIRSRTQHFEFHLLSADELSDHVRHVIADAGLDLGDDAVEYVVRQGGGSARDTLSALDQVAAMGGVPSESAPVEAILDALADHDAGAVLVAVADAMDAGRDPRGLGEVLIAHLRDAFLAAMGVPDRHLPAADADAAAALGSRLGNAGLTRALEVLGDALVELARKPDPRIVLEVALVRLCRPDADRTLDALHERLDRLERAMAAGGALPPASAGAPLGSTSGREPAPAAPTDAEPERSGPAAEARAALSKAKRVTKATAPRAAAPSRQPDPPSESEGAPAPRPAEEPAPPPQPAPGPPAATGEPPGRDELVGVWEAVLATLKPGTRAVFAPGSFRDSTATHAVFSLQNAFARDHCEKRRGEVEAALASHVGRPVAMQLVTEEQSPAPSAPAASEAPGPADELDEVVDVSELEDAPDAATGLDRLTEAFPGAELVEEP